MIFSFIIKPTHLCNFSCDYCYNEDERKNVMSETTLKNTIVNCFNYIKNIGEVDRIEFIWHGCEPLIAGIKFYEKVLYYQKKYNYGIK